jgi:N-acetylneuraminic acid mutarotase
VAQILAIDPQTGRARRVGRLPRPLSDAAVVAAGDHILVAGGRSGGAAQTGIYTIR